MTPSHLALLFGAAFACSSPRYHRVGAALKLEILMVSWKTPNKTGGTNGVPEVQSFPIRVVQRATLTR